MEQKTNYLFGMHPVFEAISAGKNIEKVLLKKGLTGEQFQQLFSLLQDNYKFRLTKISIVCP